MKNRQVIMVPIILINIVILFSCTDKKSEADLIITNANIWTGNDQQPNAQAIAIHSDTFMAVGSIEKIVTYEFLKKK